MSDGLGGAVRSWGGAKDAPKPSAKISVRLRIEPFANAVLETALMQPLTRREPVLALLLSFLWAGLGNFYNGRNIGKGILFAVAYPAGFCLFFFPGLVVWVYGMVDAYNEANDINRELDFESGAYAGSVQGFGATGYAGPQQMVAQPLQGPLPEALTRIARLWSGGMLDAVEYQKRKVALLQSFAAQPPAGDPDEILSSVQPLREAGYLDDRDLTNLKSVLYPGGGPGAGRMPNIPPPPTYK